MNKLLQKSLLTVTFCIGIAKPSLAHVIWFPPEQIGQNGYQLWLSEFNDPSSIPYDTYGLYNLGSIEALDSSGNQIPSTISQSPTGPVSITPSAPPAALVASYDRGYWIRDDSVGFDVDHLPANYLGYLTPDQVAARGYGNVVHHLRYTTALFQWSDIFAQPFNSSLGQLLQIVPLANPFSLKPGDELPVEVFFNGTQVDNDPALQLGNSDQSFTPDANGIFEITIGNNGLDPLEADYSTPQTSNSPLNYYAASFSTVGVPEPSSLGGTILGAIGVVFFARRRKRY
mgnify:CR=1 FL=1